MTWSAVISPRTSCMFATTFCRWSRLPGQYALDSAVSAAGDSDASSGAARSSAPAARQKRSISAGMSSRRARSGGSTTRAGRQLRQQRGIEAPFRRPGSPSGSALVATSTMLCLSSFGNRNASPFCSAREYWPISAQYRTPSRASSSSVSGLLREPRAVGEHDKRRSRRLQRARRNVVARAGLAEDQHRPARGDQRLRAPFPSRGSARWCRARERNAPRLLRCGGLECARDRRQQLRQPDRLLEEIERADPRRLDGGLDRAVTRHHDDRHRQLRRRAPFAQQRDAVGVGHPDVEQHERRLLALPVRARFARVLGERDAIALVLQDLRKQLADADFVVDDQDFPGLRHARIRHASASLDRCAMPVSAMRPRCSRAFMQPPSRI